MANSSDANRASKRRRLTPGRNANGDPLRITECLANPQRPLARLARFERANELNLLAFSAIFKYIEYRKQQK